MIDLRAVIVCVDFADILAVTLPRNRHHFADLVVVTNARDRATMELCTSLGVDFHTTDDFYRDGADFNKWRALETSLDTFGRWGWLCLLDADIVWPKEIPPLDLTPGKLYSPLRYMWHDPTPDIPDESTWGKYNLHRNFAEWAGYTQIFHADDPSLGQPPWHETTWRHAGGADSMFQRKWDTKDKIRLPWRVLHLGTAGINWCGRAGRRLDGTVPEHAQERYTRTRQYLRGRDHSQTDPYAGERLHPRP